MSSTLGEKLRQAREERGISISEVAEQTRISPLYIESIENDDYKPLPGGIFNKGFVKSYARYIGFDEQEALQEYAKLVSAGDAPVPEEVRGYRPEVLTDDRHAGSMLPTIIFAGIILALLTGGVLFLVNYIQNQPDEPEVAANTAQTNGNAAATVPEPAASTPVPTDRIDVELKAVSEPVWVSYALDGTKNIKTLNAGESLKIDAKDSFRISYSRSKLPNLQIFLNGKQISPPDTGKGTIEFEINKTNIAQFVGGETSAVQSPEQSAPTASFTTPRPTSTPRPATSRRPTAEATASKPNPSPKPAASKPAPASTPIVVGRTPQTRSPN